MRHNGLHNLLPSDQRPCDNGLLFLANKPDCRSPITLRELCIHSSPNHRRATGIGVIKDASSVSNQPPRWREKRGIEKGRGRKNRQEKGGFRGVCQASQLIRFFLLDEPLTGTHDGMCGDWQPAEEPLRPWTTAKRRLSRSSWGPHRRGTATKQVQFLLTRVI